MTFVVHRVQRVDTIQAAREKPVTLTLTVQDSFDKGFVGGTTFLQDEKAYRDRKCGMNVSTLAMTVAEEKGSGAGWFARLRSTGEKRRVVGGVTFEEEGKRQENEKEAERSI